MLPRIFGEERAAAMFDLVRQMADAGVRLVAGTDAGVQRAGFDGLVPALSFYSHLGLANASIIDMATSEAATALGLGTMPVTAARAKEIIEVLRARTERPRSSRPRKPRTEASAPSPPPPDTTAPVFTPDGSRADAA